MTDSDNCDYTEELNDDVDTIGFGKYGGLTPLNLLIKNPAYIIWAWNNTNKWVGSEEIVRRAHAIQGVKFTHRPEAQPLPPNPVHEFEATCLAVFGCFPYKARDTLK